MIESLTNSLRKLLYDDAKAVARMLDECGSEDEFRLRCAAMGKSPEDVFAPYAQYVALARGYVALGISYRATPSDWWAFERTPGAEKPDPFLRGYIGSLR